MTRRNLQPHTLHESAAGAPTSRAPASTLSQIEQSRAARKQRRAQRRMVRAILTDSSQPA